MEFQDLMALAKQIRERYHELEERYHGSRWSVEEDALAFLTDAALVGRHAMSAEGRWPAGSNSRAELRHKLAESVWWLMILADRMDIDMEKELVHFLESTKKKLGD